MNARVPMGKRLTVLRGGSGDEAKASLACGSELLPVLAELGYTVEDIMVTSSGDWLQYGVAKSPTTVLESTDGVFSTIRGSYGEGGELQRLLERHNIPYLGSAPLPSARALNKYLAKLHVRPTIHMPQHYRIQKTDLARLYDIAAHIESQFQSRYVVKPTFGSSGRHVLIADTTPELATAMKTLLEAVDDVLVEEYIEGRALTCGVLHDFRGQRLYTTPVVELTYENGHDPLAAEKQAPAELSRAEREAIQEAALAVHQAAELEDISRSDFVLDRTGKLYFLEINTTPSLSERGPFMAGLSAYGVSYVEFIDALARRAVGV